MPASESTVTAATREAGAMSSGGLSSVAVASVPSATTGSTSNAVTTPSTTVRSGNRALSVLTGTANQAIAGPLTPPAAAARAAIMPRETSQLAKIQNSGRLVDAARFSAIAKIAEPATAARTATIVTE